MIAVPRAPTNRGRCKRSTEPPASQNWFAICIFIKVINCSHCEADYLSERCSKTWWVPKEKRY
ncbi:unnamed protein product [Taenia asiatica]|uniref:Uncharacterized protein n=1 Tax=Taenia asiatica TaxID=60517 RepID=A0A3P6R5Z6_TAEAS|nr:unnamed protein product [Taenia asiatica]